MNAARVSRGRVAGPAIEDQTRRRSRASLGASFAVRAAFIWPALLAILFVSIFPLVVSLYISLSRLKLVRGGFRVRVIGLDNFRELYFGGGQRHFLGVTPPPTPLGWLVLGAGLGLLGWGLYRAWRAGASPTGMVLRVLGVLLAAGAMWLLVQTLLADGGAAGGPGGAGGSRVVGDTGPL